MIVIQSNLVHILDRGGLCWHSRKKYGYQLITHRLNRMNTVLFFANHQSHLVSGIYTYYHFGWNQSCSSLNEFSLKWYWIDEYGGWGVGGDHCSTNHLVQYGSHKLLINPPPLFQLRFNHTRVYTIWWLLICLKGQVHCFA